MLKQLAMFFSISLFFPTAVAGENKQFDELTSLLSAFTHFQSDFNQKSFDKNNSEIQVLTGVIKLKKPDHFYWKTDEPYAQLLVSNGKSIWHFDADLEQVVVQEYASQASQAPILIVLENPAALVNTYTIKKIDRKGDTLKFHLLAKNEDDVLKAIQLQFIDDKLVGLDFTDSLQQNTHIVFSNVQLNKAADPALFEFNIPPGVDVLHE